MAETVPAPRVNFTNAARLAFGIIIGIASFFISGEYGLSLGEDERALFSSLLALLAAAGFVPPTAAALRMSKSLALVLSIGSVVLTYLLNTVIAPDEALVRAILVSLLAFGSSVGIRPFHA